MNNKKFTKRGPTPISLRSEYSSSNWFHSNTPNSRHLFNTNMHLIHFHSTNIIKMHFPKVGFLKFQTRFRHSILISEEKAHSTQNCMHYNGLEPDLKKIYIWMIIIYIVTNFERFFAASFKFFFLNKSKSKLKIGLQSVVVHTILSRICFFFFFWDKNCSAESVLG